jgi:hypothetical protein
MTSVTSPKWHTIERLTSAVPLPATLTTTERDFLLAITLQETSKATKCTSADSQQLAAPMERTPATLLSAMSMNLSIPIKFIKSLETIPSGKLAGNFHLDWFQS